MIVQTLFTDATMALEDLHSVALEGQRRDHAPDRQRALASALQAGRLEEPGDFGLMA